MMQCNFEARISNKIKNMNNSWLNTKKEGGQGRGSMHKNIKKKMKDPIKN